MDSTVSISLEEWQKLQESSANEKNLQRKIEKQKEGNKKAAKRWRAKQKGSGMKQVTVWTSATLNEEMHKKGYRPIGVLYGPASFPNEHYAYLEKADAGWEIKMGKFKPQAPAQ